mgnify:CR=1 FL=1
MALPRVIHSSCIIRVRGEWLTTWTSQSPAVHVGCFFAFYSPLWPDIDHTTSLTMIFWGKHTLKSSWNLKLNFSLKVEFEQSFHRNFEESFKQFHFKIWTILFAKFGIRNRLLNRTTLFCSSKRIGVVRTKKLETRANTIRHAAQPHYVYRGSFEQWGLICCRFCLALCCPVQLQRLSAKGRAPSYTAKTADFFFLSHVYNQFLCSLTCTNTQYFARTLEYLAVFNIHIT